MGKIALRALAAVVTSGVLAAGACTDAGESVSTPPVDAGGPTAADAAAPLVDAGSPSVCEPAPQGAFNRGSSRDVARAIAFQADGKILVAGTNDEAGDGHPLVMRVLADGTLDSAFGCAGKLLLPLGDAARIEAALVGPGEKIVLGIASKPTDTEPTGYLVRLLPDGSPDTTFGEAGVVGMSEVRGVVLDAMGRLIVATSEGAGRYLDDGSKDPSFATIGSDLRSIALDSSGRILVVEGNSSLARLTPDGARDASFAGGESLSVPGGGPLIAPQADGSVIVGRHSAVRVLADGTVDPGFAHDGSLELGPDTRALRTQADGSILALARDALRVFDANGVPLATVTGLNEGTALGLTAGSILVADTGRSENGNRIDLHRYDARGALDASFTSRLRSGASVDRGTAILRSTQGHLVAVGTASRADAEQLGKSVVRVARLDASGQTGGALLELVEQPRGLALTSDGRLVSGTEERRFTRYLVDGRRDPDFGDDGVFVLPPSRSPSAYRLSGLQVDAEDRIWSVSYHARSNRPGPVAIAWTELSRILAPGALDPGIGVAGYAEYGRFAASYGPLALLPSGTLILGVQPPLLYDTAGPVTLAGFTTTGAQDRSYRGASVAPASTYPREVSIHHALPGPDGSLILTGMVGVEFFARRIAPGGAFDDTFLVTRAPGRDRTPAAVRLPDGGLVLAGSRVVDHQKDLYIARYTATGVLAAETVIPRGPGPDEITAIELLPDGKLLATGSTWSPVTDMDQLVETFAVP